MQPQTLRDQLAEQNTFTTQLLVYWQYTPTFQTAKQQPIAKNTESFALLRYAPLPGKLAIHGTNSSREPAVESSIHTVR